MSYNEKVIQVKIQSEIRFAAACGKTMTYEEAETIVRRKEAELNAAQKQEETWVDITTGRKFKAQF